MDVIIKRQLQMHKKRYKKHRRTRVMYFIASSKRLMNKELIFGKRIKSKHAQHVLKTANLYCFPTIKTSEYWKSNNIYKTYRLSYKPEKVNNHSQPISQLVHWINFMSTTHCAMIFACSFHTYFKQYKLLTSPFCNGTRDQALNGRQAVRQKCP